MRSDYKVYRYDRLDAPVVTAGSAAVLIGAQNGLFPDMGYAVPGEMGGLWAGEKKICDGFFLAVDDVPLTQADACEIHPVVTAFHYRMQKERLHVVRRLRTCAPALGCCHCSASSISPSTTASPPCCSRAIRGSTGGFCLFT